MGYFENIQSIATINGYEIVRTADADDPMSGYISVMEGTYTHYIKRFVDNKLPADVRGDHVTELTAINYARNIASTMPAAH
jgi:argonaute-like protein implicated in RNA metabolism and viral defense